MRGSTAMGTCGRMCVGRYAFAVPLLARAVVGAVAVLLLLCGAAPQAHAADCEMAGSLGWCNDPTTHLNLTAPLSLPSGGTTREQKLRGTVPSNAQAAVLLFRKDEAKLQAEVAMEPTAAFMCKTQRQTAYSHCDCPFPVAFGEGCFYLESLPPLGQERVSIRLVPQSRDGTLLWDQALPPATFSWLIDALAPATFIGQHFSSDGQSVVGAGPPPCYPVANSPDGHVQFELSSNEPSVTYQCRLLPFDHGQGYFPGAPERWSLNNTRAWLLSLHSSAAAAAAVVNTTNNETGPDDTGDTSAQQMEEEGGDGLGEEMGITHAVADALREGMTASDIQAAAAAGDTRVRVLAQLLLQTETPFVTCGSGDSTDGGGNTVLVRYSHLQLQHGLMLFQARSLDAAGNTGDPASYRWFVDGDPPRVAVQTAGRRRNTTLLEAAFAVQEAVNATFTDHTGVTHNCNLYTFQIQLQNSVISPFEAESSAFVDGASFRDDVNAYNISKYNYRGLADILTPVLSGETRVFTLDVSARDRAGNTGPVTTTALTIDRDPADAFFTIAPPQVLSPGVSLAQPSSAFAFFSDEEGESRSISYACRVDSTTLAPCTLSSVLSHLLTHAAPQPEDKDTDEGTATHTHSRRSFHISIAAVDEAYAVPDALSPSSSSSPPPARSSQRQRIATATTEVDTTPPTAALISAPPQALTNSTRAELVVAANELVRFAVQLEQQQQLQQVNRARGEVTDDSAIVRQVAHSATTESIGNGNNDGGADGLRSQTRIILPAGIDTTQPLSDAQYVLIVTPTDLAGNVGNSVRVTWVVDTQAPLADVSVMGQWLPSADRTANTTASFTLTAVEDPFARFECALQCEAAFACTQSPCQHPASQTTATSAPSSSSGGGGGGAVVCELEFRPCASPLITTGVPEGRHVLWVRATDGAGNTGPATALEWVVDVTPPTASIDTTPSAVPPLRGANPDVTFAVEVDETLSTLECLLLNASAARTLRAAAAATTKTAIEEGAAGQANEHMAAAAAALDVFAWQECTSPVQYTGLSEGEYVFFVRAIDAAGNRQGRRLPSGALLDGWDEYTFAIDTTAPNARIVTTSSSSSSPSPPPPPTAALSSSSPSLLSDGGVTGDVVRTLQLAFSERLAALACTHCFAVVSADDEEVPQQSKSAATCRPAATCAAMEGNVGVVSSVAAGVSGEPTLTITNNGTRLVPCMPAVNQGCDTESSAVPGPSGCRLGFLHACGVTQLSYATSCNVFEGTRWRRCVEDNTYTHWLQLELTDVAGNTATQIIDAWVFDALKPSISLQASTGLPATDGTNDSTPNPSPSSLSSPSSPSSSRMTQPFFDAAQREFRTGIPQLAFIAGRSAVNVSVTLLPSEGFAAPNRTALASTSAAASADPRAFVPTRADPPSTARVQLQCKLQTPSANVTLSPCGLQTTIPEGLVTAGGYYRLHVVPFDAAGNRGDAATAQWLIVDTNTAVHVNTKLSDVWVNAEQAHLRAACDQPLCALKCRITSAQAVLRRGGRLAPDTSVATSFQFCQDPPKLIVVQLQQAGQQQQWEQGQLHAHAMLAFLQAHQEDLEALLHSQLDGSGVDALHVTNVSASTEGGDALLYITINQWHAHTTQPGEQHVWWSAALSSLVGTPLALANLYSGQSRTETTATGEPCMCSTCATEATCLDPHGVPIDCPCEGTYDGVGTFIVRRVHVAELPTLSVPLPRLSAVDASLLRHIEYNVDVAASFAQDDDDDNKSRLGDTTRWTIYQDRYGPELAFTVAPVVASSPDNSAMTINATVFSLDDASSTGFSHASCALARVCRATDAVCRAESMATWNNCGRVGRDLVGAASVDITLRASLLEGSPGRYQFSVRGHDMAGNAGEPAAWHFWWLAEQGALPATLTPRPSAVEITHAVLYWDKVFVSFDTAPPPSDRQARLDVTFTCANSSINDEGDATTPPVFSPCTSPLQIPVASARSLGFRLFIAANSVLAPSHPTVGTAACFYFPPFVNTTAGALSNTTNSSINSTMDGDSGGVYDDCVLMGAIVNLTARVAGIMVQPPPPPPAGQKKSGACGEQEAAARGLLGIGVFLLASVVVLLAWLVVRRRRLPEELIPAPKLRSRKAFHNPAFQTDLRHSRPASMASSRLTSQRGSTTSLHSAGWRSPSSPSPLGGSTPGASTPVIEKIPPKRKQALTPQPRSTRSPAPAVKQQLDEW